MATVYFLGTADPVAKVMTATPANVEVGDIFTLLAGGTSIATFTATAATVLNVTDGLTTAWNASTHPWATGITATDSTTHVTLTSDTAGVDFVVTSTAVNGGAADTQTLTMATTTANAGPNDWSTAANWSGGAVPVNNDDVIIANNSINICWGLAQSAVTLDSLDIRKSYTGRIGLDYTKFVTSADGLTTTTEKTEYRDVYLNIKVDSTNGKVNIGRGAGAGSGRILLDTDTTVAFIDVYGTATTSTDTGRPAVRLLANNAATELGIYNAPAGVGLASEKPGETSTVLIVNIATGASSGTTYVAGAGVTCANYYQETGTSKLDGTGLTSLINRGGTCTVEGQMSITAVYAEGGTTILNNAPLAGVMVSTLSIEGGTVDLSQCPTDARTISTLRWDPPNGGSLIAYTSACTYTNISPMERRHKITVEDA